jgi:D-arabinose 5-phosphate isomerase GutQ
MMFSLLPLPLQVYWLRWICSFESLLCRWLEFGCWSEFLAAEAGHGDLGMIEQNDIAICISYSGESDEIMTLVPIIKRGHI